RLQPKGMATASALKDQGHTKQGDPVLETRSLEESSGVVVPVASSSAVCVRSGQIDCSLRLSGDHSRLSSSAIRLSERCVSTLLRSTLPNVHCSLGSSVVPWCFRS